MTYNPEIHRRRSIRLKGYDYSQAGAYFVTICVKDHACLFGTIMDGKLQYNDYGQIAYEFWLKISEHFSDAKLDEFIIMPNHIHGIITINNCRGEVTSPFSEVVETNSKTKTAPIQGGETQKTGGATPPLRKHTLGQVVAYFKYQSSKRINQTRNTAGQPIWQRNYYEHIIRDDKELQAIREYIRFNPLKWDEDKENPEMKGTILKNA
jgi:REP element-mobilizing transposase RayT